MSFYHPEYLYYLSALIIPIIIHLFNFKKFKKVYFTNTAFLKDVHQESKKHSQWRHIIIMILRMLIISSIVIAFAGPYISNNNENMRISDINNINVFIDNSFSMQARGEEGSVFDQARVISREIALAQKSTDQYRLLTNSEESFSKPYVSRDVFLDQLEKLSIDNNSLAFNNIQLLLNNSDDLISKDIYIVSDFQKAQANIDLWKQDTINKYYLIPIVAASQGNVFIDSVWIESPVLQPKQNIKLHYRIQNQSNQDLKDLPITMKIFETQKSVQSIAVAAMNSNESVINFRLDSSGFYAARIEIQDYPVVYDDVFYFSLNIQKSIGVLCISSENSNKDINTYLNSDSSFIPTFMSDNSIDYSAFLKYSTIILNSITNFSTGLEIELNKFVANGGNLIIIPNKKNKIEKLNIFYKSLGLPLINSYDTTKLRFGKFNLNSIEFNGIFETNNNKNILDENTDLPFFKKKFILSSAMGLNTDILLKDEIGDAIIIRTKINKGRIYNLLFPINSRLSNFTSHAVFIPIMFNLFRNIVQKEALYYTLGNNNKLSLNYSNTNSNIIVKMKSLKDSIEFIPQYGFQQNQLRISFQHRPKKEGAYIIKVENVDLAMPSFNYNRQESYLSYYNRNDLQFVIDKNKLKNIEILQAEKGGMSDIVKQAKKGIQLWKLFIIFALTFLIIELLLLRFSK